MYVAREDESGEESLLTAWISLPLSTMNRLSFKFYGGLSVGDLASITYQYSKAHKFVVQYHQAIVDALLLDFVHCPRRGLVV